MLESLSIHCKLQTNDIPTLSLFTAVRITIVCDRLPCPSPGDLLGLLMGLLFGQLQWVVDDSDAVLTGVLTAGELTPQNQVVGHIHVGHHSNVAFVVVPNLQYNQNR